MAVDITNHLIPYTTVKQMLATAWDEGLTAAFQYDDALENWREHLTDYIPETPTNPYQENT